MANSTTATALQDVWTATRYNNLRTDLLSLHQHDGQEGSVYIWRPTSDDWTSGTTSGSASISQAARTLTLSAGATSGSNARIYTPTTDPGWQRSRSPSFFVWSDGLIVMFVTLSVLTVSTNGEAWVLFGVDTSHSGDLTDAGIGVKITNGTLSGHAHNGSSADTVDLSTNPESPADRVYEIVCVADGTTGTGEWFVNGTSQGTTSNVSTGSNTDLDRIVAEVANNADSANVEITIHDIGLAVAQP